MAEIRAVFVRTFKLYTERQIPRAAAALSYYLTMTTFPMIICLYALFGQSYAAALRVLNYFRQFLTPDAEAMIQEYLKHVAASDRHAILLAAVTVLLMPASAAIRLLESTIAEFQGGRRFRVLTDVLLSFAFAVALLVMLFFAIVVMLTSHDLMRRLQRLVPGLRVVAWSSRLRYLLLAGIVFLSLRGIFAFSKRKIDRYSTLPGALLSTVAIVVMSFIFSGFIAASTHYPLVYGSLTSLILLMFWIFLTCQMILIGAAFNVAVRDYRLERDLGGS